MSKWFKTKYPGVRYKIDDSKKHKGKPDQYFTIRYYIDKKQVEEGVGYLSEGWSAESASFLRSKLKVAAKSGDGPVTLREKRVMSASIRAEKKKQEQIAKENELTLSEVGGDYLDYILTVKPSIHPKEEHTFRLQIYKFFGKDKPVREITVKNLQDFRAFLLKKGSVKGEPLAPRTVEFCLVTMGKLFKYANLDNIATKVKVPTYDNKRERFLDKKEAGRLLAELQGFSINLYNISIMALHLGFRAGEIFSLKKMHISFSGKNVKAFDTKNKMTRTLFMTSEVERVLQECCKKKKMSDFIFPDRSGKKRKKVSRYFRKTVTDLGLNEGVTDRRLRVTFHTLRHTYASWLIMSGKVDLYTLQNLLGHQDIKTTQRYAHLAPDHYRESASVMNRLFSQVDMSEDV